MKKGIRNNEVLLLIIEQLLIRKVEKDCDNSLCIL